MTRALLFSAAGIALALGGYFLIGFSCPYTFVSTIMTGRIILPVIFYLMPYKWVLAVAVWLILHAIMIWRSRSGGQSRAAKPSTDPFLFVVLSFGVAAFGFLALYYPCPYAIDLWLLLKLEIPAGEFGIPYGWVLTLAAGLLLYAAYMRATQKRGEGAS